MVVVSLDVHEWAKEMFGHCSLGDRRRTQRLVKTSAMLASQVGSAPSRASAGDEAASEGAYRLIRNGSVSAKAIAQGGFEATVRAASGYEELLAVEDTTSLSYAHAVAEELGDLGGREGAKGRGFIVHSVLLVDGASEQTVGLIDQRRWCRDPKLRGQRHHRRERAYEDKESSKWEQASRHMSERLGETMQRVISVCDRESDVYEYLRYKTEQAQRYVIRASWDRKVCDEEHAHLFASLEAAPILGQHRVKLAQRGSGKGRKAREVCLDLRARPVELQAPRRDGTLGTITLNVVLAQERTKRYGVEPVRWLLLTSEPISDLAALRRVVRYYALRWRVEEFHKAWKSGAGVERRRMGSADNLERIAVMLAFVAVRVLQLREVLNDDRDANDQPERLCTEVLSDEEWQVLWVSQKRTKPPLSPPTLRWAYEAIARLGGWTNSKRTGRAGWDTMWHGWFRFQERLDIYLSARDLLDERD